MDAGPPDVRSAQPLQYPGLDLHLAVDRLDRPKLADRLQRGQHRQPVRLPDPRFPLPDHRAGPAPDPQSPAQSRRYRHLADDPDPGPLLHPRPRVRALAVSLRSPLSVRGDGIELAVKASPRAGRSAIGGGVLDAAGAAWLAVRQAAPATDGRAKPAPL